MGPTTNHTTGLFPESIPTIYLVNIKEELEGENSDFMESKTCEKKLFLPFGFWVCFSSSWQKGQKGIVNTAQA